METVIKACTGRVRHDFNDPYDDDDYDDDDDEMWFVLATARACLLHQSLSLLNEHRAQVAIKTDRDVSKGSFEGLSMTLLKKWKKGWGTEELLSMLREGR